MALIRCYERGKEISSLATVCPSCGAPPRSTIVPPPLETASESSPSPTATETPYASDASIATAPPPRATYQVIGIPPGDYLNVREGAGSDYQVITKLEPGTRGILLGTKRVASGATAWQERTVHGQT